MSEPYTPTNDYVLKAYHHLRDFARNPRQPSLQDEPTAEASAQASKAEFDRWLAEHDRQVKAEAWEEGWCEKSLQVDGYEWDWNPYRETEQ